MRQIFIGMCLVALGFGIYGTASGFFNNTEASSQSAANKSVQTNLPS